VIGVDPVERKIALSIREYQRDLDSKAQAEYGKSGGEQSVSVGDAVGDALPRSMLQAGRSLADAAQELMAAVARASAEAAQPVPEPVAEPVVETPVAEVAPPEDGAAEPENPAEQA